MGAYFSCEKFGVTHFLECFFFSCLNYSSLLPYHAKENPIIKPREVIQHKITDHAENYFGNWTCQSLPYLFPF